VWAGLAVVAAERPNSGSAAFLRGCDAMVTFGEPAPVPDQSVQAPFSRRTPRKASRLRL
jgi:hypothetical protein